MSRTCIKLYVTPEWLDAIRKASVDKTPTEFVRDAVKAKLPSDVRKKLPEMKRGKHTK